MKGFLVVLVSTVIGAGCVSQTLQPSPGVSVYVSPAGNDRGPGTIEQPLATLEGARDLIRSRHMTDHQAQDITVFLREGIYRLDHTFALDSQDSGRNGHLVRYQGYRNERVVISGGRRINGFVPYRDGIFMADVGTVPFSQFYVNGRRAVLARYPNRQSEADFGPYLSLHSWTNNNRIARVDASAVSWWKAGDPAEMVVIVDWDHAMLRIGNVQLHGTLADVTTLEPERTLFATNSAPDDRFQNECFFQNSLSLLDAPGEWYLDAKGGKLYYKPREGERLDLADCEIPALDTLLDIKGASDVELSRLTFEYSRYLMPDDMRVGGQANVRWQSLPETPIVIPGAIQLRDASRVGFDNDIIQHTGGSGIEFAYGTLGCYVNRCNIRDISANGINVFTDIRKQSNYSPEEAHKSRYDRVSNCCIYSVGQVYTGSAGVLFTFTKGGVVEHNEVFNCPYVGINFGWHGGENVTATQDGAIRYNNVHHIAQLHPDTAAIYTLGNQKPPDTWGLRIEENYIHDIPRSPWSRGSVTGGIYLDNNTSGALVQGNVFENLADVSINVQMSSHDNTLKGNEGHSPATIANAGPTDLRCPPVHIPAFSERARMFLSTSGLSSVLCAGESLCSPNGGYRLLLQRDGDLVLRDGNASRIWHSNTGGNPDGNYRLIMQGDGNLVLSLQGPICNWPANDAGRVWKWDSRPVGPVGDYHLMVSNDGKLQIRRGLSPEQDGGIAWSRP